MVVIKPAVLEVIVKLLPVATIGVAELETVIVLEPSVNVLAVLPDVLSMLQVIA